MNSDLNNKRLLDLGEKQIINNLSIFGKNNNKLKIGIGDDCAVCASSGEKKDQVLTSDATVQDIHFLPSHDPKLIGYKAIGRVYSDLASMGATPEWVLINIVAPKDMIYSSLEKIYMGINDRMNDFGGTLIGGDLTEGEKLSLNVFATGSIPKDSAITRMGAEENDIIWTTGKLGESNKGKHLDFVPRIHEGMWLRESGFIHSMTDVSDGLYMDLMNLINKKINAVLDQKILDDMSYLFFSHSHSIKMVKILNYFLQPQMRLKID